MAELTAQLITHVLDRVRSDLTLLESVRCITPDLEKILAKLPTSVVASESTVPPVSQTSPPPAPYVPSGVVRKVPPPPVRHTSVIKPPMAEAKWDYESDDPADLAFKQGDMIEIVEETSSDWWRGRLNGREGLFPSNRCVKVEPTGG
ncbi:hypothetical protein FRC11_009393 [Ceratobasidium sp. 423]|nr:hypothetical protein FRC11_009393 [Ceratobasidium sp. 423]